MSDLTSELNLKTAVDDDDTADYLTLDLKDSLQILDGLFNAASGHAHNGAHQGGALQFLDLTVGEDLTVVGASQFQGTLNVAGAATLQSTLNVGALATLNSLDVTTTTRLRGAVTVDGTLNAGGTLTVTNLAVTSGLAVGANLNVTGAIAAASMSASGVIAGGQVNSRGYRTWDAGDFAFSVAADASKLVQRDGNGYIVASFINYAGGAPEGGKPVYILGRTAGDSYLRWWPATAIGPPTNVDGANYYVEAAISGSWATTDGSPGTTWTLTLPIAGHWIVEIEAYITVTGIGGGANGYVDVVAAGPVTDNPTQYLRFGATDQQVRGGYGKSAHGVYAAGTQQTWRIPGSWRTANGNVTGKIVAHFVPSNAYPG